MMCVARDVNVSEEHHDVAFDLAVDVHTAKEAHGVANGVAGGYVDVAAELDHVAVRMGGGGGDRESRCQQESKESSSHRYALLPGHTQGRKEKFPGKPDNPRLGGTSKIGRASCRE